MANWRNVTPSNHPQFLVKGVELNTLVCGANYRFQICEIRAFDPDGFLGVNYVVRDADTVNDAEVKDGVRPKIVYRSATLLEAETFINDAQSF